MGEKIFCFFFSNEKRRSFPLPQIYIGKINEVFRNYLTPDASIGEFFRLNYPA